MIFIFILWILCRLRSQRKSEFWFTPRLLLISPVLFLFLLALLQASRIAAVVYDFLNSFELSNSGVSGNTQDDGLGGVEKGSHLLWNISMLSPELKLTVISSTPSSCRKRTSCPPGSCWRCSPPPRGRCSRAPGSPGWWGRRRRELPHRRSTHFSPREGGRIERDRKIGGRRYLGILRLQLVCYLRQCHSETCLRHRAHSQLLR